MLSVPPLTGGMRLDKICSVMRHQKLVLLRAAATCQADPYVVDVDGTSTSCCFNLQPASMLTAGISTSAPKGRQLTHGC